MHLTSLATTCIVLGGLALAAYAESASLIKVPVSTQDGLLTGQFDVGNAKKLTLSIATQIDVNFINPGSYDKSELSADLGPSPYAINTTFGKHCISMDIASEVKLTTMALPVVKVENVMCDYISPETSDAAPATPFPHDGVLGIAGPSPEGTFISMLYAVDQSLQHRYGLALGTTGTGSLILGGFDKDIAGDMQTARYTSPQAYWSLKGEVSSHNGTQTHTFEDQDLLISAENFNVVGPMEQVRTILNSINGSKVVEVQEDCGILLSATYPCDTILPEFGFAFWPATASASVDDVWHIHEDVWRESDTNNICTAPIVGLDNLADNTWLLGQAFLRGKYVDFNVEDAAVTFAKYNDPHGAPG